MYTGKVSDGRYGSIHSEMKEELIENALPVLSQTSFKRKRKASPRAAQSRKRALQNIRQQRYRNKKKNTIENFEEEKRRLTALSEELEGQQATMLAALANTVEEPVPEYVKLLPQDQEFNQKCQSSALSTLLVQNVTNKLPHCEPSSDAHDIKRLRLVKATLATFILFGEEDNDESSLFDPKADIVMGTSSGEDMTSVPPQQLRNSLNDKFHGKFTLKALRCEPMNVENYECIMCIAKCHFTPSKATPRNPRGKDCILDISLLLEFKGNKILNMSLSAVDDEARQFNHMALNSFL